MMNKKKTMLIGFVMGLVILSLFAGVALIMSYSAHGNSCDICKSRLIVCD